MDMYVRELHWDLQVTIKGKVSTFNAYAKLIAIGIKIITAALLVTKLVKSDININKLHNINAFDCPYINSNRFLTIS